MFLLFVLSSVIRPKPYETTQFLFFTFAVCLWMHFSLPFFLAFYPCFVCVFLPFKFVFEISFLAGGI